MIGFAQPYVLLLLALPIAALVQFRRRWSALLPRTIGVCLLITALAGPRIATERDIASVVLLVDQSPSVERTDTDAAMRERIQGIAEANPGLRYRVITFADVALAFPEVTAQPPPWMPGQAVGEGSNLAAAVDLALAVSSSSERARFVLVSDGRFTAGRDEAIARAQRAGVTISCVPAGATVPEDVALTAVYAPPEVGVGQPLSVRFDVLAHKPGDADISLYRDDVLLHSSREAIIPGVQRFTYVDRLSQGGGYEYRAVVRGADDPWRENDSLAVFTRTSESPRILLLSKDAQPPAIALLETASRSFVHREDLPTLEGLAGIRQILIAGVALQDLSALDIATLRSFALDLGGSVLLVQGEEDVRGYSGEALEQILPVTFSVPERAEEASLAVVFLLDRSSSMRGHAEGATKIEILQEAAAASVRVLEEEDLVGILAFDREYAWLSPIEVVAQGEAIYERLRALTAEGGTDIYYPLVAALDALSAVTARVKHVILLSDGKTVDDYRDYAGLYRRLSDGDIGVSAVAIGEHPNRPLLSSLTDASGGTLYEATDIRDLPAISVRATQQLSRGRFITGTIAATGSLLTEPLRDLPPLGGYCLTYAKPTADVLLSAGGDPLFTRWRLGEGWVAVLNTDLSGVWSAEWLGWPRAALLFDAMVSAVEPTSPVSPGLDVLVRAESGNLQVLVDASDESGQFANGLSLEAIILPEGTRATLPQVGTGLYAAELPLPGKGGYALQVLDLSRRRGTAVPFSVPYRTEYRSAGIEEAGLALVAQETGGIMLTDGYALPPLMTGGGARQWVALHGPLLLAALAAFLCELMLRKLPRWRPIRH